MICPVCLEQELVSQSEEDSYYPDLFCPKMVRLKDYRPLNHYREFRSAGSIRVVILPYRILIYPNETEFMILTKYKNSKRTHYFKKIYRINVAMTLQSEEKMLAQLKLIMVLS
jgi:hypothetical protein